MDAIGNAIGGVPLAFPLDPRGGFITGVIGIALVIDQDGQLRVWASCSEGVSTQEALVALGHTQMKLMEYEKEQAGHAE